MVCFNPIHSYYPVLPTEYYHTKESKRYIKFTLPKYDYALDLPGGTAYFDYETRDKEVVFGDAVGHFKVKTNDISIPKYIDCRLPCGKCIGCLADKSRNYATRAIHEYYANREQEGCFVTLTFNDDMLYKRDVDNPWSVSRIEFSGFIKRMRERIYSKYGKTIRVFGSAEYGELHLRPHYHMIIYGFNFPDKYETSYRPFGKDIIRYYRSDFLEDLWKPAYDNPSFGFSSIGELTQNSCQYVSRYTAKKLNNLTDKEYKRSNTEKPFLYTPSKEGLGFKYFQKYYKEIYANGYCHWHNGVKAPIPSYYNTLLKKCDPDLFEVYKLDKLKFMFDNLFHENLELSEQRLKVREEVLKLKNDKCIRSYEELSNLHNIYYLNISKRYKKPLKRFKSANFIFDLKIEDARKELVQDDNMYDFIFLDAFTPAKCPALWTVDFFKLLFQHLSSDGMILTYSNSAAVRNAFLNAGFYVGKIFNPDMNKFTGTIAVKNKSLIEHELSEYDLGLLKTKAGIFYRDENLAGLNEAIIKRHQIDIEYSNLISSSKFIKDWNKQH